ncbi:hypothetical protein [Sulfobacillus sp. hq2]|nr:hypothetical protein [Sulfobacillus sp. hq2]
MLTQHKSGAQVARELGIPSKRKAEDQALRDLQRRIRDLEEEKAI